MKCLTNNLEVNYPCSAACPLYGDCVTAFRKEQEQRVRTNADRIRCMSDEELAEWIYNGVSSDPCDYCEHNNGYCDGAPCKGKAHTEIIAERLKQPAEEVTR